jgi:hypothetical protein
LPLRYTCPVCGYPDLTEPPPRAESGGSYEICYCCGFEFGVTDEDRGFTYEAWRQLWIDRGMPWDGEGIDLPPADWDPRRQLAALLDEGLT